MNDREDDLASVDVSIAFFACILILFVFVSFELAPPLPASEQPSTGQSDPTVDMTPGTWAPVARRSSFAFLTGRQVYVLDQQHFVRSAADVFQWVDIPGRHHESVRLGNRSAPNAFRLKINTTLAEIPQEWIRQSFLLPTPGAGSESTGISCVWPEPTPGSKPASAAVSVDDFGTAVSTSLTTVLVDPGPETALPEFLSMARACGRHVKLVVLSDPNPDSGLFDISITLTEADYASRNLFR